MVLPLGLANVAVLLSIMTGSPPRTVSVTVTCRSLLLERRSFVLFVSALQFLGRVVTKLR